MLETLLINEIQKQLTVSNIMSAILGEKLVASGVKMSLKRHKVLKRQVKAWLEKYNDSPYDTPSLRINFDDGEYPDKDEQVALELTSADVSEFQDRLSKLIEELTQQSINDVAELFLKAWQKHATKTLKAEQRDIAKSNKLVSDTWGRALYLLEMLISISTDVGATYNDQYRNHAVSEQNLVFDAIARLHARGCQISREITILLQNGFADGAHARWRTLYELSVVASFIKKHGNEIANRFLCHADIDTYREMERHQKHCAALGWEPIDDEDMHEMKDHCENLVNSFGEGFESDFGWAGIALGAKRPNFGQLEENAGLEHFRPFFKIASRNVHASSRGTLKRLGQLPDNPNVLIAGPSVFGLGDPGRNTAHSVCFLTAIFLQTKGSLDNIAQTKALHKLMIDTHSAFYDAEFAQLDKYHSQRGNKTEEPK